MSVADIAFTADTLADRPVKPRLFNVPGMLPAGTVTTIDGDGGTGKSTLALQLAVATALNKPWLGLTVIPGRALYLSAEDDVDELHRRLSDITLHYGVHVAELSDLKILPLSEADAVLAAAGDKAGGLVMTALWRDLEALVDDWAPKLIVLDSRADVFGGNENDRRHARHFVGMLRELAQAIEGAVVINAHPSVSGMQSGAATQYGRR